MAVSDIGRRLKEISSRSAVSLITDIDSYFAAMKEVVKHTEDQGTRCIYITSTIPSTVIKEQLSSEGLSSDHVYFIDCISYMVGSSPVKGEHVSYVESPTMLEAIMLKVQMAIRHLGEGQKLVFLDSINTMSLHNDERTLSEFTHYLINSLRVKGIPTVVLSIVDQTPEDLDIILKLVCDEVIEATGPDSD